MNARTYRGKTMKEALARVRRDLGGDAVILAAREVRRRRLFGLGPRGGIEVEASLTMPADPLAAAVRAPASAVGRASASASSPPTGLGSELGRIHTMVETLSRQGRLDHWMLDLPSELTPIYGRLLEADVPELLARQLVRMVADAATPEDLATPDDALRAVREALEDALAVAPPIRAVSGARRVVALVGPTGVGKTTTAAKLAARFKLQQGLRVGLLTVDTYRIAAIEQLKTYADIIDLPLAVGRDPESARQAIDELGDVDLVLVDTAGRSPKDEPKIQELGELLARIRPDEVHLVLSAATSQRSLRAAAEQFAPARPDRLLLTKLDEAESLGALAAILGRADRPVSYLTTGQSVPDDIEEADRSRLARLILGEESIA
ncbi:MAG: flagellar biosynthesis protein FlhF [Paludisphaera borealis]|uniref:flagellar biosynthesis protein FlhF n=1 Tax=Paludisphaera borealis TaxID=1387353 RepID=UPI002840A1A0|nr:flagellar biosynthesis protein FlhF [Paludisphaera borealis]MDR3620945.1 flagellar biosynthesis protein FlhF [Paludisphaera borealis]